MPSEPITKEFNPRIYAVGAVVWAFLAGLRVADFLDSPAKRDTLWMWEHSLVTLLMLMLPIGYPLAHLARHSQIGSVA
jgi:hypothetical protein